MNQKDIFEHAYHEFADSIFRYLYYRVFDRDLARDLTQETFYRVWDYLAGGRNVDNMKAFLYRTAHNIAVNAIRSRRPSASLEHLQDTVGFDAEDEQVSRSAEAEREVREVVESFSILKDKDAELMRLRFVDGLSVQEISSITKVSENSISVKIHRLVQKLREYHGYET
jgi:RNA polymerase sigma-70 factor (ECF subfamily)